ncbi:hypothetical protein GW17_00057363, partial [Ensete ventricosum]
GQFILNRHPAAERVPLQHACVCCSVKNTAPLAALLDARPSRNSVYHPPVTSLAAIAIVIMPRFTIPVLPFPP